MRFIHTGDIHLGAHPENKREWAKDRGDEIWGTFERLIKKIKMDPVDLLIIAGDLFHRQPLREIKEVDYLLSTIPDTKVVICAGNHDAIKKGSFYEGFQWSENVIFLEDKNIMKADIDGMDVCVYGLSYHETEIEENLYDHIMIDDIHKINILVAHGGDEKHIPVNRKKLAMSGFDYVAMGHIHKPEIDEKNKMAYCGSLEPIDMNDMGQRGYIYGEVSKHGLELEFVPFARRIYKEIAFTVTPTVTNLEIRHKLADLMKENGEENMFKVILTVTETRILKSILRISVRREILSPYRIKRFRILILWNYMKITTTTFLECLSEDIWIRVSWTNWIKRHCIMAQKH